MTRLLWLWVLLLIASLIIGPWMYSNRYCCSAAQTASETIDSRVADPESSTSPTNEEDFIARFSLSDGVDFRVSSPDHFSFNRSLALPNIPGTMTGVLDKIAIHLKANPSRLLSLTGYYAADEENNTPFENLGLARANSIKEKLLALGVAGGAIQLGSAQRTNLTFVNDVLEGGVGFEFGSNNLGDTAEINEAKALEELGKSLKARPLRINFETNSSTVILTDELSNFLKNVQHYMGKVPEVKLSVTGHTDSDGTNENNDRLSKTRAAATRTWLGGHGLDITRITTAGKGEREPVADNSTDTGKAINRRAEIIIVE